jgi:hypothetical protein
MIVAPEVKLVPISVTAKLVPGAPLLGLMLVNVGSVPVAIVKTTALLVPLDVVTVTLVGPGVALAAMVKVAVIWVGLFTLTLPTVTPGPALTMAPEMKLAPVNVTGTLAPCVPLLGLMLVNTGGPTVIVKATGLLVPLEVVTVTLAGPVAALAAMVKVAVIWVRLFTLTLPTVTPGPALTMAPEVKLAPVSVTGTLAPCVPLLGLMLVNVGSPTVIVKTTALLVPLEVVTLTLAGPVAALAAMVKVAVIWVRLFTLTPPTVTPGPALTMAPEVKLAPVNVTGTLAPCVPLLGLMLVNVGSPTLIVKATGLLVPLEVVTVTLAGPVGALAAMVNVT